MQDARALADAANNSDAEAEDPNIALEKAKPFPPLNLLLHKPAELELKESAEAAASFEYDANAVGTAIGLTHDEVAQLKSEHLTWRSYLLHAQQELVTTGSRFVLKTVLDLAKCRIFRVNQRSNRVTFRMHVLLLNTTATNLEVSVEPERGFSFMNATKTVSRNSLIENTLNNLMVVGLHSPCVLKAANDLEAKRQLDEFLESCLTKGILLQRAGAGRRTITMIKTRLWLLAADRKNFGRILYYSVALHSWPQLMKRRS
jgi:hypothetical protein